MRKNRIIIMFFVLLLLVQQAGAQTNVANLAGSSWSYEEEGTMLTIEFIRQGNTMAFSIFVNNERLSGGIAVNEGDSLLLKLEGHIDWAICSFNGDTMDFIDYQGISVTFKRN